MATTEISDIIIPDEFLGYVIERTAQKSELVTAGIIDMDPEFSGLVSRGGELIQMPFWKDLTGSSQVPGGDGSELSTKKIGTGKDQARRIIREDAWAVNDLSGILAGSDPLDAIVELVGDYWARDQQRNLLASLKGVFAASSMSSSILDIHQASGAVTTAHTLNGITMLDATQLMGDQKSKLTAIAIHSAVETYLKKLDLIDYMKDSEGGADIAVYQGRRVIVDDTMPTETVDGRTVYNSYLFGQGAFALGNDTSPRPIQGGWGDWYTELARKPLADTTFLINRKQCILHPRGVKWTESSVAGVAPTDAELETAANWERVYEQKNVRLVKVRHNIA